jgi:hypothetical protein
LKQVLDTIHALDAMRRAHTLAAAEAGVSQAAIDKVLEHLARINEADPVAHLTAMTAICLAFTRVRNAKTEAQAFRTRAMTRKKYLRLATALRRMEIQGECLPSRSRQELVRMREDCEALLGAIPKESRRSGGKKNIRREVAVQEAHFLCTHFGEAPKKTRGKAWHVIAGLLYDDGKTDLWSTIETWQEIAVARV